MGNLCTIDSMFGCRCKAQAALDGHKHSHMQCAMHKSHKCLKCVVPCRSLILQMQRTSGPILKLLIKAIIYTYGMDLKSLRSCGWHQMLQSCWVWDGRHIDLVHIWSLLVVEFFPTCVDLQVTVTLASDSIRLSVSSNLTVCHALCDSCPAGAFTTSLYDIP